MRCASLLLLLAAGCLWGGDTVRLEVAPPDYRFKFKPTVRAAGQRRLVLALGGGAAKGIAHTGVLQVLDEEGFEPDAIAGTSAGAFVGGMYGCGYSGATIQSLMQRMDLGALLLDRQRRAFGETLWEQEARTATVFTAEWGTKEGFVFTPGASTGLELKRSLQWLLSRGLVFAGTDFSSLRGPFRAVSTNLQDGVAYAPARGNLVDVVRASMSIPGMFRPVMLDGKQHVDGMLVENLPVFQAKELSKELAPVDGRGAAVLAVEVGGQLDDVRATSLFTLLLRTLDVTIEERTRFSRNAADMLVRPETRDMSYLDFSRQVPEAVALGRASMDGRVEELEALLYGGLWAGQPITSMEVPDDLRPAVEAVVRGAAGPGHAGLRTLRRLHAAGLCSDASLAEGAGGATLRVMPQGRVRAVSVVAPPEWKALVEDRLGAAGQAVGARFNPVRFGQALEQVLLEATLSYRPLLDFTGSGFVDGELRVRLTEPRIASLDIAGEKVSKADRRYIAALMAGLEGAPLNARTIFQRLAVAESRLNLEELALGGTLTAQGPAMVLTPLPKDKVRFDVSLAYESTWGFHAGVGTFVKNLFGSGNSLEFQGSTNQLQDQADLDFRRAFHAAPRSGAIVFARHFAQRFPTRGLQEPRALPPEAGPLADRTLRAQDAGIGFYQRFGNRDQGLWRVDLSRRWTAFLPAVDGVSTPPEDSLALSAEWDSFDRYTFPTSGSLLRLSAGEGRSRGKAEAEHTHRHFYLRARQVLALTPALAASLDMESGLGWRLPVDRWYSLGGPAFLMGSRSADFLAPNFVLLRAGFPIRVAGIFGLQAQLEPRWDMGYLGGAEPSLLREGLRVRAIGLALRTEVGRFYVEIAAGRMETAREGQPFESRGTNLNLLVGTRPFDLWKRR